jgi:hypothetical protein
MKIGDLVTPMKFTEIPGEELPEWLRPGIQTVLDIMVEVWQSKVNLFGWLGLIH